MYYCGEREREGESSLSLSGAMLFMYESGNIMNGFNGLGVSLNA